MATSPTKLSDLLASQRSELEPQSIMRPRDYLGSINPLLEKHLAQGAAAAAVSTAVERATSPERSDDRGGDGPVTVGADPSHALAVVGEANGGDQQQLAVVVGYYSPSSVPAHQRLRVTEALDLACRVLDKLDVEGGNLTDADMALLQRLATRYDNAQRASNVAVAGAQNSNDLIDAENGAGLKPLEC